MLGILPATCVFAVAGAVPYVDVDGPSGCPTPMEVADRLQTLLPPTPGGRAPDHAYVDRLGGDLRLRLLAPDGQTLMERRIAATAACGDLASAAAVILASWEAELNPGLVIRSAPQTSAPVVAPSANGTPPAGAALSVIEARREQPSPRVAYEVGAGTSVSVAGGSPAPGLTLDVAVGRAAPSRVALTAGVGAYLPRDETFSIGRARWTRFPLSLGLRYRVATLGPVDLDLEGQGMAAWVIAQGRDFPVERRTNAVVPGARLGVRLARREGTLRPWVAVAVARWRRQYLSLVGDADREPLPVNDLFMSAGIDLGTKSRPP